MSMDSTSSTSSTPPFRVRIPSDFWIGRSGAILSAMARAFIGLCQTMLMGWRRYKDYPDPRVRERFIRQMKKLSGAYNAALWVMEHEFKKINRGVSQQIRQLRHEVESEFPIIARLSAMSLGPFLLWSTRREERRLARGRTYEPPSFLERSNWNAASKPRLPDPCSTATTRSQLPVGRPPVTV